MAWPCAPGQHARMPVVPGEKIGSLRPECFLSRRRSDCYGHDTDDGIRPVPMSKPSHSFPRPLSELLSATLSDVLKAQGFASTEIISRWNDIVGPEIAGHSEPLKINWPRAADQREAGTRHIGLAGRGPGGARNPAPVGGHSRSGQSFLRLAGHRPNCHSSSSAPAPGTVAGTQKSMMPRPRRSPALSLTSRTTICVRRSAGWVRRSREIEPSERLGRRACHCHNCAIQLANTLNSTGV